MKFSRGLAGAVTVILLGSVSVPLLGQPAGAAASTAAPAVARTVSATVGSVSATVGSVSATVGSVSASCRSAAHPALAARLARDIDRALRGRVSTAAVGVDDPGQDVQCWLDSSVHFDSASVVKVIILGALLRLAADQHRHLTRTEAALATEMITRSDNDAASALWAELGRRFLQDFLDLAKMNRTYLGPGPAWGLTQITAYDEVLLLRLLLNQNRVLDTAARDYALGLMARVIPSQRWGVPVGAPRGLVVHVKNGWLPLYPHGWRINSIGCFTGRGGGYSIVVLTQDNPTMTYGIDTIQAVARAVNHDLNPGATSVVPAAAPSPSWGKPDEIIPAR
jgi:beta-lactamase class A